MTAPTWRQGQHYGVHVYTEDDVPVATFFTSSDAEQAVREHNFPMDMAEMTADRDVEDRFNRIFEATIAELRNLRSEIPVGVAAVAAVERAKALHCDSTTYPGWCVEDKQPWPTIRALEKP